MLKNFKRSKSGFVLSLRLAQHTAVKLQPAQDNLPVLYYSCLVHSFLSIPYTPLFCPGTGSYTERCFQRNRLVGKRAPVQGDTLLLCPRPPEASAPFRTAAVAEFLPVAAVHRIGQTENRRFFAAIRIVSLPEVPSPTYWDRSDSRMTSS